MTDEQLIGRTIELKNTQYRVTDVRSEKGGAMVYAERVDHAKGPSRAAFHLDDVRELIAEPAAS